MILIYNVIELLGVSKAGSCLEIRFVEYCDSFFL